jgi:hypothetical protein
MTPMGMNTIENLPDDFAQKSLLLQRYATGRRLAQMIAVASPISEYMTGATVDVNRQASPLTREGRAQAHPRVLPGTPGSLADPAAGRIAVHGQHRGPPPAPGVVPAPTGADVSLEDVERSTSSREGM